jgi:hypothetical protein
MLLEVSILLVQPIEKVASLCLRLLELWLLSLAGLPALLHILVLLLQNSFVPPPSIRRKVHLALIVVTASKFGALSQLEIVHRIFKNIINKMTVRTI